MLLYSTTTAVTASAAASVYCGWYCRWRLCNAQSVLQLKCCSLQLGAAVPAAAAHNYAALVRAVPQNVKLS
jgi:hypothetical protein